MRRGSAEDTCFSRNSVFLRSLKRGGEAAKSASLPRHLITAIALLSWELCESRLKPSCQGSLYLRSAVFEVSCAVELTRPLNMLSLYVTIAKHTVPSGGIFSKDCDFLSSLMKKLFAVPRGLGTLASRRQFATSTARFSPDDSLLR